MHDNDQVRQAQQRNPEYDEARQAWFDSYRAGKQAAQDRNPVPSDAAGRHGYLAALRAGAQGAANVKWAREGQMVELCRSNYTGHTMAGGGPAPSVIDVRVLQEDEILLEVAEPFFYQVSTLGQLD